MKPQLMAAFEESLRDAPDQETVLIGLRAGLERHRQRRRRQRVVLATAAVVVLVVVSLVTVNSIRRRALPPVAPLPIPAPAQEWPSAIQAGWVPDGMSLVRKTTGATSETLFYSADKRFLNITLDKIDLNRKPTMPGWQENVTNGRPSRSILRDGQATVVLQLPSGRWAQVNLAMSNPRQVVGPTTIAADIAHVTATLKEVGGPPVRNSFELTYLPPGQRIVARQNGPGDPPKFNAISTSAGTLQPGNVGRHPVVDNIYDEYSEPDLGVGLDISLGSSEPSSMVGWEKIADIQGRPAYRRAATHAIIVTNFHGGTLFVSATFNGAPVADPLGSKSEPVPLAELVKVAEGVR